MGLLKVFLDTNILLDSALQRKPWNHTANQLIEESKRGQRMKAYVSSLSLKDVYYIAEKVKTDAIARKGLSVFLETCEIVDINRETCEAALNGPEPDFEDGLILAAAQACKADVILSRDEAAFNQGTILKADPALFASFFFANTKSTSPDSTETWAVADF